MKIVSRTVKKENLELVTIQIPRIEGPIMLVVDEDRDFVFGIKENLDLIKAWEDIFESSDVDIFKRYLNFIKSRTELSD